MDLCPLVAVSTAACGGSSARIFAVSTKLGGFSLVYGVDAKVFDHFHCDFNHFSL